MAGPTNSSRKQKTFPDLDVPAPNPAPTKPIVESDNESSDEDSDAPEAVTLTGGREVEEAKANALKAHQARLQEKRKAQNKSREAFIQSTKSKSSSAVRNEPETKGSHEAKDVDEEENSEEGESANEEDEGGDPVLLARMAKAMQEAQEEDEEESSEDEDDNGPTFGNSASSTRLPDSIFAAAAAAHQAPERKRKSASQKRDEKAKRRRVREGPTERVVGGRTLRVTTAIDAPPPLPSISTRKANNSVKGGNAFRRKWKKRDALQAQIRSRSGPARNFATTVQ